uniref:Uncharacterized protein n=1 Tax=Anguilla anguilla TaxID=7936 RepID=A0A0E9R8K8_ANGAN
MCALNAQTVTSPR